MRPQRILLNAPSLTPADKEAVTAVMDSGWIGSGPECAAFEAELATFLQVEHVVCVSSCTIAMELMLDLLGIRSGSRVAVPAWTYPATAMSAAVLGAEVVLIDCSDDDLTMDARSLEAALSTTAIDAVVPVHFAGVPVSRAIWKLCDAHAVPIVEDAAHAFGTWTDEGPLNGRGSVGAAFSFHATKNLTCGEGGAIATHDPDLARALRRHRLHGLDVDAWDREERGLWEMGDISRPGHKANLPDVLAALGRSQLRSFGDRQSVRHRLAERYRAHLGSDGSVRLVPRRAVPGASDHLMVAILPEEVDREAVIDELAGCGISTGLHYTPLHHLTWFQRHATVAPGGLPTCDRLASRAITLPLHVGLADGDVDEVCERLLSSVARATNGRTRRP